MTDDPLGWLDYVPVGGDRSTGAEILLGFERTMLCDERLPEDYRREVRERIWRRINESRRYFDSGPQRSDIRRARGPTDHKSTSDAPAGSWFET